MKYSSLLIVLVCIYLFNGYILNVQAGSAVTIHYYDVDKPNGGDWDELSADHTPALFGTEPIIKDTTGLLIPAGYLGLNQYDSTAALACELKDLNISNNPKWVGAIDSGRNVILIVDRGGNCPFEDKVYNAQRARMQRNGEFLSGRVIGVLVADDHDVPQDRLDYMADIGTGHAINIPSALITQNHANFTKQKANVVDPALQPYAVLEFFLPNENTVEYKLFTGVLDVDKRATANGTNFKVTMGDIARQLKTHAKLTYVPALGTQTTISSKCIDIPPHRIIKIYCTLEEDIQSFDGRSLVVEAFRQFIISQRLIDLNASHMIYEYWKQFYPRCTKTVGDFTTTCSVEALELSGLTGAPYYITSTWLQTEYVTNASTVYGAKLAQYQKFKPLKSTSLYINDVSYYGTVGSCQPPLSQAQCDYLQWICAGYLVEATPKQCTTDVDCPFGQTRDACSVCNGTNDCKSSSGVTMAVLFGIIFVAIVVLGAIVYLYVQKQQAHTKTEVDTLLRQYLPTDSGLGTALSNSDIKKTQQTRLIESDPSDA